MIATHGSSVGLHSKRGVSITIIFVLPESIATVDGRTGLAHVDRQP